MRKLKHFWEENHKSLGLSLVLLLVLLGVYSSYQIYDYKKRIQNLQSESDNLKNDLTVLNTRYTETLALLETNKKDKESVMESLNQIGLDYNNLMQKYNQSIDELTTLQRTAQIDDELLKKYSKFYFLNENYKPENLSELSTNFTENGKKISLLPIVKFRLENMFLTAKADGVELLVNSGYRSFEEQKNLKSRYSQVYGTKANQFSADQGYSEHQLGTTVDITDGNTVLEQSFEKTKSYKWLQENAYKYGFILSYPKNNKFYIYEPWHWRFVGLTLAKYLHENNLNFYDLDQKEIDKYKLDLFK